MRLTAWNSYADTKGRMTIMNENDIISLLDARNGELHCPVSTCDMLFPDGMGYGFLEHYGEHSVCLACERELEYPENEFLCLV